MTSLFPKYRDTYNLTPRKGTYYSTPLVAWITIEDCNGERCRIHDICNYQKSTFERTIKCMLLKQYINSVSEMVHRCFSQQLQEDEHLLFRIGMHLMPLYKTLCKLKMEELAVSQPVFTTVRGDRKADPVYRELRETIKMIMQCWKDLGLDGVVGGVLPLTPRGDVGYEDELFEEEPQGASSNPPREKPQLNVDFE